MALHRFKMLADQVTEQVVWMSYYIDNQPPCFETNLNYQLFNGSSDLNVWKLYCSYQLYYNHKKRTLYKKAQPTTDFEYVKFLRAKSMAINYVNSAIDFQYEKYNYSNHQMYRDMASNDRWITTFQIAHNCTEDAAKKLLAFKREEYELAVHQLESLRYIFNNRIKNVQTMELIDQYYEETTAQLINSNRIKLSETPIVIGMTPESDTNQA